MGLMSVMADIWRSRSRSALTMSAVAIGIFSVTVISAAGQIGTAKINDSLDDMGVNSVLVEAQEAGVALSDSDIDALGGLSGVNGAMPLMAQVTKCELIESNVSCMVWGVNEKADEIISMKAIHGRLIDRSDLKKADNICVIDDEIALEWARIPHFYTPFYVYQYATGYSAAIAISTKILAGDEQVIAGYRKFLSGGSSMHPIELLKLCGIDMTRPDVVQEALDVFGELLKQW